MGYQTDGLKFNALREANARRIGHFRNSKGGVAHDKKDGSDWTLSDWITAITGELGELANIVKKVRRGDYTIEEARPMIERETADVNIYLDIFAKQAGFNLGDAIIKTFNKKSKEVGSGVYLAPDDWHLASSPDGIPVSEDSNDH